MSRRRWVCPSLSATWNPGWWSFGGTQAGGTLVEPWWNSGGTWVGGTQPCWRWSFGGTLVELWWSLGWWNPTLVEPAPPKSAYFLIVTLPPIAHPWVATPGKGWPGGAGTPKLPKTEFLIIQSFEMGHFGVEERLGSPRGGGPGVARGGQDTNIT